HSGIPGGPRTRPATPARSCRRPAPVGLAPGSPGARPDDPPRRPPGKVHRRDRLRLPAAAVPELNDEPTVWPDAPGHTVGLDRQPMPADVGTGTRVGEHRRDDGPRQRRRWPWIVGLTVLELLGVPAQIWVVSGTI